MNILNVSVTLRITKIGKYLFSIIKSSRNFNNKNFNFKKNKIKVLLHKVVLD